MLLSEIGELGRTLLHAAALTLFLFVVPGLALLSLLRREITLSLGERFGLAAGLSVALYPCLFLWSYTLGQAAGPWLAWTPGALGSGWLLWRAVVTYSHRPGWLCSSLRWGRWRAWGPDLAWLLLAAALFGVRMTAVDGMVAPAWGDSVHHTQIVQLLLDHGGLFQSWAPYAPMRTFTYHFGFHTIAAVWAWVSGQDATQAVLQSGQVANSLAVLALYPLAVRLGGSRGAGLGALWVAGLWSPLPAFYVNWGRYTQLTGQILLPTALWLYDRWWLSPRRPARMLLALLLLLHMAIPLTHYRLALLAAAAALSWGAWSLWQQRRSVQSWLRRTAELALTGLVALTLIMPWIQILQAGRLPTIYGGMAQAAPPAPGQGEIRIWLATDTYFPHIFWMVGLVALALALWRRPRLAVPLSLWALLAFLAANPSLVGLPGTGWIGNFTLVILLYLPLALLWGWLMGWAGSRLWASGPGTVLLVLLLAIGLLTGLSRQLQVVDPFYQMVTAADRDALAWVRANTPPDAYFAVNGFLAFNQALVVGSDGGWWLPLYGGRASSVPPVLYGTERLMPGVERAHLRQLTLDLAASGGQPGPLAEVLCREGITHLFLGDRRGQVGIGNAELLPNYWFLENPDFELLYRQAQAEVWRFRREICP